MSDDDDRVWVLGIDWYGPEPGDYAGYTSVHRSREGAATRLHQRAAELGMDVQAVQTGEDIEDEDGVRFSYGISHLKLEP